ncbi:hypothetical protein AAZX31_02G177000 [Glycine max]
MYLHEGIVSRNQKPSTVSLFTLSLIKLVLADLRTASSTHHRDVRAPLTTTCNCSSRPALASSVGCTSRDRCQYGFCVSHFLWQFLKTISDRGLQLLSSTFAFSFLGLCFFASNAEAHEETTTAVGYVVERLG